MIFYIAKFLTNQNGSINHKIQEQRNFIFVDFETLSCHTYFQSKLQYFKIKPHIHPWLTKKRREPQGSLGKFNIQSTQIAPIGNNVPGFDEPIKHPSLEFYHLIMATGIIDYVVQLVRIIDQII